MSSKSFDRPACLFGAGRDGRFVASARVRPVDVPALETASAYKVNFLFLWFLCSRSQALQPLKLAACASPQLLHLVEFVSLSQSLFSCAPPQKRHLASLVQVD